MDDITRRGYPHQASAFRWTAIVYAINDTRRTIRLCAILLAGSVRIAALIPVIMLLRR
jgi:hypothetical protein